MVPTRSLHQTVLQALFTAALAVSTTISGGWAASLSFVPAGAQLDGDPIADIETEVGDEILFSVLLDTTGLGSSGSLDISYNFRWDFGELGGDTIDVDVDFGAGGGICNLVPDSCTAYYVDLPLDQQGTLSVISFDVLPALVNDGAGDFAIQLVSATIDGLDVTSQFSPASQEVEVQPVPEPVFVKTGFLGSLGLWFACCRMRHFFGSAPRGRV